MKKIKVAIVGVSGYTGLELVKILLNHPHFELSGVFGTQDDGSLSAAHPSLAGLCEFGLLEQDFKIEHAQIDKIANSCSLAFLALPHQKAMEYAKELLARGCKVVDLSADYRLSAEKYEEFYTNHSDKENLKSAVYGLVEYSRERIKNANLCANPGCYPTASLLAILPFAEFLDENATIYIDAKSGVSGAGKKLVATSHFVYINENLHAYSPISHRHSPEIGEHLQKFSNRALKVLFVPHLVPLSRGMLISIYARLRPEIAESADFKPLEILRQKYKNEKFIRVRETPVQIKNVAGTHFCDIFAKKDGADIFINSSIDNLLRGASSQAVANANLMCGFEEDLALPKIAYAP